MTTTTTTIFDLLETEVAIEEWDYLIDEISGVTTKMRQVADQYPESVQAVVRQALDGILQSAKNLKVLLDLGHGDTGWQSDRCSSMSMLMDELIKISTYATEGIDRGWEAVG